LYCGDDNPITKDRGANEMHDLFTQAIAKQQVVFDKMVEALQTIEDGDPVIQEAIKAGEEFKR
jgi:hypothetical protein